MILGEEFYCAIGAAVMLIAVLCMKKVERGDS